MKQPKLWRRWFESRKARIEITHETTTRLVIRTAAAAGFIRCPNCGSDLPVTLQAVDGECLSDATHEGSRQLVLHSCEARTDVERTIRELLPGDQ